MRNAPDASAALYTRFAFAFVHLPEPFKGFTVRKAVRLFEVDPRSRAVGQRVTQNIPNRLV